MGLITDTSARWLEKMVPLGELRQLMSTRFPYIQMYEGAKYICMEYFTTVPEDEKDMEEIYKRCMRGK